MRILTLETSTSKFSLAVSEEERVLVSKTVRLKGVLSSSIIPAVDAILKKAKLSLGKIDCFGIGLGPGSFTSLRVGLSTVKALSLATGKPVVGIPSLDATALAVADKTNKKVCVLMDAKRNLVYGCLYHKQGAELVRDTEYLLVSLEKIWEKMDTDTVWVGDALKVFQRQIKELEQTKKPAIRLELAKERFWYPEAKYLSRLVLPRARQKRFDNPDKLVPLYLYPDHCQVSVQS